MEASFWDAKENCDEKGKTEIWRNGRGMWKMLLRTGLEAQSWKARNAKRSFPLLVTCPKESVGTHKKRKDVERGKKERCWTEAYPGKGEKKSFPKCSVVSLSIFSQ